MLHISRIKYLFRQPVDLFLNAAFVQKTLTQSSCVCVFWQQRSTLDRAVLLIYRLLLRPCMSRQNRAPVSDGGYFGVEQTADGIVAFVESITIISPPVSGPFERL